MLNMILRPTWLESAIEQYTKWLIVVFDIQYSLEQARIKVGVGPEMKQY